MLQYSTSAGLTSSAVLQAPSPRVHGERPEALLVQVAELLHRHGTPAHRLERLLARLAASLGVEAQFLSTPTSFLAAFGPAAAQETYLLRVEPGETDLGKLVELDLLLEDLEAGRTEMGETRRRLEALRAAPARYGPLASALAFGGASAGAAVLFSGGGAEAAWAFILAAPLAWLAPALARREEGAQVFEPLAAFLVALAAMAGAGLGSGASVPIVTLAALIVLVPGLTLTQATIELTTRHLVSGTARMAGAMTTFLSITLGLALGRALGGSLLPPVAEALPSTPPVGASALAVGLSPVAFAVLFQVRGRELPWVWLTSVCGYGVAAYCGRFSPEAGPFLGALAVGLAANLYARLADRPALVLLTPGILMLVPGSVGYRALDLFLGRNALAGTETIFRMAISAVALAGGLLLAGALLPPRRTL